MCGKTHTGISLEVVAENDVAAFALARLLLKSAEERKSRGEMCETIARTTGVGTASVIDVPNPGEEDDEP